MPLSLLKGWSKKSIDGWGSGGKGQGSIRMHFKFGRPTSEEEESGQGRAEAAG